MGEEANATFTTPDRLEQGAPADAGKRRLPAESRCQSKQLALMEEQGNASMEARSAAILGG